MKRVNQYMGKSKKNAVSVLCVQINEKQGETQ